MSSIVVLPRKTSSRPSGRSTMHQLLSASVIAGSFILGSREHLWLPILMLFAAVVGAAALDSP
jgi:hypothetical protein